MMVQRLLLFQSKHLNRGTNDDIHMNMPTVFKDSDSSYAVGAAKQTSYLRLIISGIFTKIEANMKFSNYRTYKVLRLAAVFLAVCSYSVELYLNILMIVDASSQSIVPFSPYLLV